MVVMFTVSPLPCTVRFRRSPSSVSSPRRWNLFGPRSKLGHGFDPSFEAAAVERASLRFQETHKPDPLFVDQYAGCLVSSGKIQLDTKPEVPSYCVATKFIDDKLLSSLKHDEELRQVVFLTDGMDTRPYRLNWPRSTLIFDISPEKVFTAASLKLKEVGAKTGRSCLFIHIPSESSDIEVIMRKKGFKGTRPSFWVLQGLPLLNLVSFKEILNVVSNLAIKGCLLLGELPSWLSETEVSSKSTQNQWIDNLFMSHGFQVNMIQYDQVARDFRKELKEDGNRNILFVAEQLRYSDDQMETWRREFQRIEEEADEEGFEEL
ncbi:OLC1v1004331C3 [Oldenlandia corymbosa var. corymbosa]|uniref:OLC1v1004331C3 n=1 Tax=Oldenlandia corymbosa var. corymbosa TaxID=529605 RepID=A0AAV1DC13_OLDCO|nr:OLC1v1004331C3 [Oldenlandia corymbosa var. corymbosa]